MLRRELLNRSRKEMGISAAQMADKLGISKSYYRQIESGLRTGTPALWDSIEDVIGKNQRDLREIVTVGSL